LNSENIFEAFEIEIRATDNEIKAFKSLSVIVEDENLST